MKDTPQATPNSLISSNSILITGGTFVQNNSLHGDVETLKPLHDEVAPNAILNAGGRADPVHCYPGTRREVLALIENWIEVDHVAKPGIFWLSGPAGAGKSAIVQTIAERCLERNVPMANFFFFRADSTRNHLSPVVPTLLFQLFEIFPVLRSGLAKIISQNPLIFKQHIKDQFRTLLEKPVRDAIYASPQHKECPVVILIDGLDECSSSWQSSSQAQISLLRGLYELISFADSPFIALVASRTEAHLTTTFNEIGMSSASIYLDDTYRPSADIRLFLNAEFTRIKATHSQRATLSVHWPTEDDVSKIVDKSSGQFIYAATVSRFIADSAASPARSLEIVLGLRPRTRTSPYAAIDALYTLIFSHAEDWHSAKNVLATERVFRRSNTYLSFLMRPLGISEPDIQACLSDLTSIVHYDTNRKRLNIFHASLMDFLLDGDRSGKFFIDLNDFACQLVPFHFANISTRHELINCSGLVEVITAPTPAVTKAFQTCLINHRPLPTAFPLGLLNIFMRSFASMYDSEPEVHQSVTRPWSDWMLLCEHTQPATSTSQPQVQESPFLPHSAPISQRRSIVPYLRSKFRSITKRET